MNGDNKQDGGSHYGGRILELRTVFVTLGMILVGTGALSWNVMPREEDPDIKERAAIISVVYPGASVTEMDRLIAQPLEDELADIPEIKEYDAVIRSEVAILGVELAASADTERKIDEAWRDVAEAVDRAARDFPDGALPPELNRGLLDLESIVFAIQGGDRLAQLDLARRFKERLLQIPTVARITIPGDPGEELSITLSDSAVRARGLAYGDIARQLAAANALVPAGSLRDGGRRINVSSNASFQSVEELRNFPLQLRSGDTVLLGAIARVERTPLQPPQEMLLYNGAPAVGLGVVARDNIDMTVYGREVRAAYRDFIAQLKTEQETVPVDERLYIETVTFQPDYVEARLSGLSFDLLLGIAIVAAVVILAMGLRVGLLAATLVPIISAAALALYAMGGGVLHQISISAFVLSLGLLIDNVIVIVESVQQKLDEGQSAFDAAANSIREFFTPLATATGTTVAAFLPMFGASGATSDFTRAIPLIAMLTLSLSFLFSVFVTPVAAMKFLRPGAARQWRFTEGFGAFAGRLVYRRTGLVLLLGALACALGGAGMAIVDKKFFPNADRDQLVLDLRFSEGGHFSETRTAAEKLSRALLTLPEVEAVTAVVGRSLPQFYYNLPRSPRSPHVAQFLIDTTDFRAAEDLRSEIDRLAAEIVPAPVTVVRRLEQGPPVRAPILVRLAAVEEGAGQTELTQAAEEVLALMRRIESIEDARTEHGVGAPNLKYRVGDANAARFGLSRADVTATLLGRSRGLPVGQFRAGEEPIDILIRSPEGEDISAARLSRAYLGETASGELTVDRFARPELQWEPAVLRYRNRTRIANVLAEVAEDATSGEALAEFRAREGELQLPDGVRLEYGGEEAQSGEANTAILQAMPAGMALLLASLLFEFRSFRKVGIILLSAPLAMAGVAPGLMLSGNPFGFLSLLGMLALLGIVVNNGILLIGAIDERLHSGESLQDALCGAIARRLRPILLTTLTTVAGLLPLAFTDASLWPPFAWTIIAGLSVSTSLTVLVVPAVYKTLFGRSIEGARMNGPDADAIASVGADGEDVDTRGQFSRRRGFFGPRSSLSGFVLPMGFALAAGATLLAPANELRAENPAPGPENEENPAPAEGPPLRLGLDETVAAASRAPRAAQAREEARRARAEAETLKRATYYPKAGASLVYEQRDSELYAGEIPLIGRIGVARAGFVQGGVEVEQPIYDPAAMHFFVPSALRLSEAAQFQAERTRQEAAAEAAFLYLDALALRVQMQSLREFVGNLNRRQTEVRRLFEFGRVARSDLLRVQLARDDALQALAELEARLPVLERALGRAAGYDRAVQPQERLEYPGEEPELQTSMDAAYRLRFDWKALQAQLEAREQELEGIAYEWLPAVFVRGRWNYLDSGQFQRNNWFSVQAGVRLSLYEGGTRETREEAGKAQLAVLRQNLVDVRRGIRVQVEEALAEIRTARRESSVRRRGAARARDALQIELNRYRQGSASLNDLLDAEELLREQNEKLRLAPIEVARAWIRFGLATGLGVLPADVAAEAPK